VVEQGGGTIRLTRPCQGRQVVEQHPEGMVRVRRLSRGVTLCHSALLSAHVCCMISRVSRRA
jgi:hypothetical protein